MISSGIYIIKKRVEENPALLRHPLKITYADLADLVRLGLDTGIKAESRKIVFRTDSVVGDVNAGTSLDKGLVNAAGLITYGGAIVSGDVDAILGNWDGIVAVEVTPRASASNRQAPAA